MVILNHRKMSLNEIALVSNFVTALKEEDVDLLWSCLSTNNKKQIKENVAVFDERTKKEFLKRVKRGFEEHLEDIGISDTLSFHDDTKTRGFTILQIGVKTHIHYIADAKVYGYNLPMELDNEEYKINVFIN
ncbi:hypothetical protein HXA31_20185 [Salipaludibacillus agaradhaerens]|uniref:hypothetical protein n=2 Tax=Salipaludibacillus TaxID=1884449 RepID=UPI002150A910|nr:hypothetical protein [Salipaludibacillus agaradhaerens]MCR6116650.1 hypothetical protein [Salipaludibacillus agaradhaerens]